MPYLPQPAPAHIQTVDELRQWVEDEFRRLALSIQIVDDVTYNVLYTAPPGPVNGMTVYADGTTWDPGSGEGLYAYEGGAWVKL